MKLFAKDLMTRDLYTLEANHSLNLARFLMQARHIRHIPIVDFDFRFQGLLTHRDLLEISVSALAELGHTEQAVLHRKIPIRQVMKSEIYTALPETPAEEIAEQMLEHKYGCVPVVSEEKLIGIITEAYFLRLTLILCSRKIKKRDVLPLIGSWFFQRLLFLAFYSHLSQKLNDVFLCLKGKFCR